jgi:hypothetical protein
MAYYDVAQMASSGSLGGRITACVAIEGESNPNAWATQNIWLIVSAPGWGDAWAYAINSGKTPDEAGADPGVITDGQILGQVQAVRA